jgi:hypothetical protein
MKMPQILVVTDSSENPGEIVYRERVARSSLESEHFAGQLLERVGWAVGDADELESRAELGGLQDQEHRQDQGAADAT